MRALLLTLMLACNSGSPERPTTPEPAEEDLRLRDDSAAAHFELLCGIARRTIDEPGTAVERTDSLSSQLEPQITHDGFGYAWSATMSANLRGRAALVAAAAAELSVEWECPELVALWNAAADEATPIETDGPLRFTGPAGADELSYESMQDRLRAAREAEREGGRVFPQPCGSLLMQARAVRVDEQVDPRIIEGVEAARAFCREALAILMTADPERCLFDPMAQSVVESEGWQESLAEELGALEATCR